MVFWPNPCKDDGHQDMYCNKASINRSPMHRWSRPGAECILKSCPCHETAVLQDKLRKEPPILRTSLESLSMLYRDIEQVLYWNSLYD